MPDYPTVDDCVFCKIVSGQVPCHLVHETDELIAFLDVNPLGLGHTLIIPRGHYTRIEEMPGELSAAIGGVLPEVAKAVRSAVGCKGINILQNNGSVAGQVVDHVHFHVIPKWADAGLIMRWDAGKLPPGEAAETLAVTIRGQLTLPTS